MKSFGSTPSSRVLTLLLFTGLLAPAFALAHVGQGDIGGGFVSGFEHPILGPDHVIAMVAVGMWGAQLGAPAIWLLPVTFPLVMAFGAVLGATGVPLPGTEIGIAVSAIALGGMVLLAARPPLWIAAALVGVFAIFHGHAHGAEMPGAANVLSFSAGFVIATGLLHLCGILLGLVNRWPQGAVALRSGGALVAAGGVYFLVGHFTGG